DGATAITTTDVHVNDAALSLVLDPPSLTEGSSFTGVVAHFTDGNPNPDIQEFTATITWGDGHTSSGTIVANGTGFDIIGSNVYTEVGTYELNMALSDEGGSQTQVHTTLTVDNAALTLAVTTADTTIYEGQTISGLIATLSDANPYSNINDLTALINWGDGT